MTDNDPWEDPVDEIVEADFSQPEKTARRVKEAVDRIDAR